MPHHLPTCPICYATAAIATVLFIAGVLKIVDMRRAYVAARGLQGRWYRSNIKLPQTRAADYESS